MQKFRFYAVRQRGSHMTMYCDGRPVPVPKHDPIAEGALRAILEKLA
ncbi:type II toxin-antitoxin system HicA family toxin [Candidatus Nitrosotenuis uzonensis]|uniref:YcfA family protein n=1 Tax=Candidatus Nitrosotenuis uzonensis TaxID=1407055 RepID=A0A812EWI6_9ARCH|nr:type II toxin-antitoxin system HicA family toxin [Candidatus Nitrosotenuis uzonensis]CAE6486874.1 conserved hypothetical protein [Candidatus Nitrosotenuis uzonensis]